MGSGVLLAALVVLWFVGLVPMVVTRGDRTSGRGGVASSGRTLQRRRAVDPVLSAETERVAIDREQLRSSGELQVDVHAIRRRTLGALVALALLARGAGALVGPWAWPVQGLLDLAVVGYVLVLRRAARRERLAARRAARAAAREAPPGARRPAAPAAPHPASGGWPPPPARPPSAARRPPAPPPPSRWSTAPPTRRRCR